MSGVAAAVIVMGAVMVGIGVLQKGHCLTYGWNEPDQFWRACYSDVTVVTISSALADGSLPYAGDSPSDQPVLSGLVMWGLALLSPASGGDLQAQRWTFGLWALAATLVLALATVALVAVQARRPWQAAHLAVSPVIAVLALMSVDLVGVLLVVWALWAWQLNKPVTTGTLLGLAFLVRPFPLLFLLAAMLLGWRAGRRRHALTTGAAAASSAVAVYLPMLVVFGEGVSLAPRRFFSSGPGYGGTSLLPSLFGGALPTPVATAIALGGWALALGTGLMFSRRIRGRLDAQALVTLCAPMMLVVILTSKAVSVQTGLWLLPFLALSALPWRDHLVWAAAEVVHFEATWLYIGFGSDPGRGLPGAAYAVTVLLRAVAWTWVLCRVSVGAAAAAEDYGSTTSLPEVAPDSRSRWASATRSSS